MTEENPHIGYYHFVVEPFHEDFTGHISWNLLGIRLLQCASEHAAAFGFGSVMAEQEACIWVLSRLTIEMNRRPMTHQDYCIETWVDSIYRQFTNRYYRIVGADGTVYGTASSVWALIGRESRRPVSLEKLQAEHPNMSMIEVHRTDVHVPEPARIKGKATEPCRSFTAHYSDIDINGHVNSIRYIDHILDLFSFEKLGEQEVKRIDMTYSNEAFCHQQLDLYLTEEEATNCYVVEIKHPNKALVCKARVEFAAAPDAEPYA